MPFKHHTITAWGFISVRPQDVSVPFYSTSCPVRAAANLPQMKMSLSCVTACHILVRMNVNDNIPVNFNSDYERNKSWKLEGFQEAIGWKGKLLQVWLGRWKNLDVIFATLELQYSLSSIPSKGRARHFSASFNYMVTLFQALLWSWPLRETEIVHQ